MRFMNGYGGIAFGTLPPVNKISLQSPHKLQISTRQNML